MVLGDQHHRGADRLEGLAELAEELAAGDVGLGDGAAVAVEPVAEKIFSIVPARVTTAMGRRLKVGIGIALALLALVALLGSLCLAVAGWPIDSAAVI